MSLRQQKEKGNMSHCSLSVTERHWYCICYSVYPNVIQSEFLGQKQSKTRKLFSFKIGIWCISQSLKALQGTKWHVRFYTFMGYSNRISGLGFKPLYWISYRGNPNPFFFLFFFRGDWVIKGRLSIAKLIHISHIKYFIGYVIKKLVLWICFHNCIQTMMVWLWFKWSMVL